MIPIVDLFAGPGGLGEGFASCHRHPFSPKGLNSSPFDVVLSLEKDKAAIRTLNLRKCLRILERGGRGELYSDAVANWTPESNDPLETIKEMAPGVYREATQKVLDVELGPETRGLMLERIAQATDDREWVLIGGPPCQAYSVIGRSRNKGIPDYIPELDHRHYLYEEFLHALNSGRPAAFILENVKGLLSATVGNRRIFQTMLADLADPGSALMQLDKSPKYRIWALTDGCEVHPDSNGTGSAWSSAVVRMERYGVPQARHRIILLGLRVDIANSMRGAPASLKEMPPATVADVLRDLPRLRSRLSRGRDSPAAWQRAVSKLASEDRLGKVTSSNGRGTKVSNRIRKAVNELRVPDADIGGAYVSAANEPPHSPLSCQWATWYKRNVLQGYPNHESRGHMASDLHRYLYAASFAEICEVSPKSSDFPRFLWPKHRNFERSLSGSHFADRFRVQVANRPSTTVTSHIHKDGHYYIHFDPGQVRSLTVREAARLQTFPDDYVFLGPRTEQFRQVGNAVPPFLAAQVALIVYQALKRAGVAD